MRYDNAPVPLLAKRVVQRVQALQGGARFRDGRRPFGRSHGEGKHFVAEGGRGGEKAVIAVFEAARA